MMKWSAWLHSDGNGMHYVMIRNHKTSRCLVYFTDKVIAEMQTRKLNAYPWQRLSELYKTAMVSDILTLKDNSMSFASTKLNPIEIEKGEGCYGLIVWCDGKKYIFKKEKYKKDLLEYLKRIRMEYTDEDIIATVRRKVQQQTN